MLKNDFHSPELLGFRPVFMQKFEQNILQNKTKRYLLGLWLVESVFWRPLWLVLHLLWLVIGWKCFLTASVIGATFTLALIVIGWKCFLSASVIGAEFTLACGWLKVFSYGICYWCCIPHVNLVSSLLFIKSLGTRIRIARQLEQFISFVFHWKSSSVPSLQ